MSLAAVERLVTKTLTRRGLPGDQCHFALSDLLKVWSDAWDATDEEVVAWAECWMDDWCAPDDELERQADAESASILLLAMGEEESSDA